jgi:hypothetical protein
VYYVIQKGLHDYRPRILLPWPSEICGKLIFDRSEIRCGRYLAVVDRNAGIFIWAGPTLRCNEIVLPRRQRFPHVNATVLENHCRVPEYEIHGPINIGFSIELAFGVSVEGVLVTDDGTSEDD